MGSIKTTAYELKSSKVTVCTQLLGIFPQTLWHSYSLPLKTRLQDRALIKALIFAIVGGYLVKTDKAERF